MKSSCVLTLALLVSTPAFAAAPQDAGASPQASAKEAAGAADGVVCRSVLQSGTRFKKKICARKAAWLKHEEEAKKAGQELLGQGANTAPGE